MCIRHCWDCQRPTPRAQWSSEARLGVLRPKRRQDGLFGCPDFATFLVITPVIKSIIEIMKLLDAFMPWEWLSDWMKEGRNKPAKEWQKMIQRRNDCSIACFPCFLEKRFLHTDLPSKILINNNPYLMMVKSHAFNGLKSSMESKLEGVCIHRPPRHGCRSRDSVPRSWVRVRLLVQQFYGEYDFFHTLQGKTLEPLV